MVHIPSFRFKIFELKSKHLTNNPTVTLTSGLNLQLAINTQVIVQVQVQRLNFSHGTWKLKIFQIDFKIKQIARTFQDRSHIFSLVPRSLYGINENKQIENVQVRGKRGNIVQTFPGLDFQPIFSWNISIIIHDFLMNYLWSFENPILATEYDFVPNRLEVDTQTLIHIQWAGSNTNDKVCVTNAWFVNTFIWCEPYDMIYITFICIFLE